MSRVQSRKLSGAAPLDRAILDSAASPVRVAFGVLFLGWSWVSTVLILGRVLAPALPSVIIEGVPTSYVVALGFALLVTAIELVSAGRWALVYTLVLLVLDVPFTALTTYGWLTTIIAPLTAITQAGAVGIGTISIVCGVIAAIFGEVLLFGRRH